MAAKKEVQTIDVVTIQKPSTGDITARSASITEQAKGIKIVDRPSAESAGQLKANAQQLLKLIDETFDSHIKQAHELHKGLLATKRTFTDPINANVVNPINAQLRLYDAKLRQEEQAEAARRQEEARREHEERKLNEAKVLQDQGQPEAAEALLEEAIEAPPPMVEVEREKIAGVGFRTVWKWKIVDITKLPLNLLVVTTNPDTGLDQLISTTGIGALVRSLKGKAEANIPGIKVWEDRVPV